MKQYYAQYAKITAKSGEHEAMIQQLQNSAEMLKDVPECIYYLISTTEEPDAVCVVELWTSKEAKDAFGERPEIAQAMQTTFLPLIASMDQQTKMTVVGGIGVE